MRGYREFEFDLPGALLTHLVAGFATMEDAPLDPAVVVAEIPEAQGVYQLFLDGNLSYIGKTDAEAGLRRRLERHSHKIQHRTGLDPARVSFRAMRIFVFTAVDLETQLIRHYGIKTWNGSGFGSNDPGRERDTTTYKLDHFDALYPIDIDRPLLGPVLPKHEAAAEYFRLLRERVPYTFRAQNAGGKSRQPHPDLNTVVSVALPQPTTRTLIAEVVRQLPPGWQATKLPSHVILYKEAPRPYPSGQIIAQS